MAKINYLKIYSINGLLGAFKTDKPTFAISKIPLNLLTMFYKILSVAFLSSFEIYVAIATGMAFKLSPHTICIATLVGGISGVFIAAFLGDKIKAFIAQYRKPKEKKADSTKEKLLLKLWHKYGVFGIGFVGTFLLGAPASIGIGYGFGVKAKQLVNLCLIAVVIRCVAYSYFFDYLKSLF